ncbi:DUF1801 domain-containing protein [Bacillus sp. B1-b2]|uniref:DUF1801 domain-containing protein n=1 Tax=Bacillus sp. B1-b2 TaxID=2653201 RepID=UPI001262930F|nr:DUF1801 domain-containing protein [Bacillus sp. B1-b2]KAB7671223.1 DUF1801 domain-containing protein [Bacillus sp. B1-b2]
MYKLKTTETDNDVIEFIESVESKAKKEDTYKLVDIFSQISGYPPKMWGPSIIGFGSYHYKYATGHEGDAPIVGFSPRKANISLYLTTDEVIRAKFLKDLGKHKPGKSCVYINKLTDIREEVLNEFIEQSVLFIKDRYQEN